MVVEHDEDTIRRADHLIDIGPGAGQRGGYQAQGRADLTAAPDSQTGRYLLHAMRHPLQARRTIDDTSDTAWPTVHGALPYNLQQITARVPLHRLVAVTGVSGSGKSTLARMLANVAAWVQQRSTYAGRQAMDAGQAPPLHGCTGLQGFDSISRVLEVDQTPIGKTPRSCPATYIGFWDSIRKLFAQNPRGPSAWLQRRAL